MSRHPYTYAADYVRHHAGHAEDGSGTKLSRSDASQIISGIAEALGMEREALAIKLSEHFQRNQQALAQESVRKYMAMQR